jgi:hypothetical protein
LKIPERKTGAPLAEERARRFACSGSLTRSLPVGDTTAGTGFVGASGFKAINRR